MWPLHWSDQHDILVAYIANNGCGLLICYACITSRRDAQLPLLFRFKMKDLSYMEVDLHRDLESRLV